MRLSVVTTLYNSAPYIEEFARRACAAAEKITDEYELILVDDGSPDESLEVAQRVLAANRRLRIVELSRNFGHHKAMMTGLEHARGDLVFLIDVDHEEPPELLDTFHAEMERGAWDVVYGSQEGRKGAWLERQVGALGWSLINLMLPIRVPRNHSTVRLMRREYVDALLRHREHKTAIGGLWVITGFRQAGVTFRKGSRPGSSYTFMGRAKVLLDSITSFSEVPLFGVFFLGLGILAGAAFVAATLVIRRFTGTILEGWVSVMVSVWLLGGLAIFSIGVVGLYVSRIFIETKGRPYTIVRRVHETSGDPSLRS